jgi:hypothetical protein
MDTSTMVDAAVDSWRIAGSYFEACNCEAICPCRSVGGRPGGRSTEGICQFALSWHIIDGSYAPAGGGETDLSGLDVVMAGFYVDDERGSPWQVVLYVDERAGGEQQQRLADIFLGRVPGGARDNFAAAVKTVHAVRSAAIDLDHRPGAWSIGVEGWITVDASERVDCDEPVACGIPGLDRPGTELRAEVMRVADDPLSWELHGRCAFTTDFDYRSAASQ